MDVKEFVKEKLEELELFNPKLFVYESKNKIIISSDLEGIDSRPILYRDLVKCFWRYSYDHELSDAAFDNSLKDLADYNVDPTTAEIRKLFRNNKEKLKQFPKGKKHKSQNPSILVYLISKTLYPDNNGTVDINWDNVIYYIQYLMLTNYKNELLNNSDFYDDFKFIVNYEFGLPRVKKNSKLNGDELDLVELKERNEEVKKILKDKISSFKKNFDHVELKIWHEEIISSLYSYTSQVFVKIYI